MRMTTNIFMKLNTIQPPSPPPNDNNILNQILVQLNEWLALLSNLIHTLVAKLNDAFPPETRARWLAILPPWVIAAVGVILLFLCCCCLPVILRCMGGVVRACWNCVKWLLMMLWRMFKKLLRCVCCCCGNSNRSSVKMMKGPGTGGALIIPRSVFESNPQGYFVGLRSGTLV